MNEPIKNFKTVKVPFKNVAHQNRTNLLQLTKLLLTSHARRFQSLYFTFIQPLLILIIYGTIVSALASKSNFTNGNVDAQLVGLVPGIIATSSFGISTTLLINNILSMKETVVIKRIAITPITKGQFLTSSIFFVTIMSFLSGFWSWGWAELLYHNSLSGAINHLTNNAGLVQADIGWLWFFVGWILLIAVSSTVSFIIIGVSSTVQTGIGLSQLMFFPASILGGGSISPALFQKSDALRWISFFVFTRYPIQIMREGFFGQNIFAPSSNNILTLQTYGDTANFTSVSVPDWFAFVACFALGIFFFAIMKRSFKWNQ